MVNKQTSVSLAGGPVFGSTIWTPFWDRKLNACAQAGAPLGCENMDVSALVGRWPNDRENEMVWQQEQQHDDDNNNNNNNNNKKNNSKQ